MYDDTAQKAVVRLNALVMPAADGFQRQKRTETSIKLAAEGVFRIGVSVTGFVGLGSVVFEFFERFKNETRELTKMPTGQ